MTSHRHRRDKVFGHGPRVPLDREAKIRVMAYAKAWNARHRHPGQHRGPHCEFQRKAARYSDLIPATVPI